MPMSSQGESFSEVRGTNAKLPEVMHHLCTCIFRPATMGILWI